MKPLIPFLLLAIIFIGCQAPAPPPDNSAQEAFARNSATVMSYLEAFQNENVDYSIFADDFIQAGTAFGAPDSNSVEDMKESQAKNFARFDITLESDPLNLLPGVNAETKEMDGSVRYYAQWKVTKSATDSTEAKSGIIKSYTSFDFNEEGKIAYSQFYGDVGGLMKHLYSEDNGDEEMSEE